MFDKFVRRFKIGWAFGSEALAVIKAYPKLLVFPVLSAVAMIGLIVAWFMILGVMGPAAIGARIPYEIVLFVSLAAYLLGWIVSVFLSTALCGTILMYQASGTMSVREGLAVASRRLPKVIAWAIFAATIGVLLALISKILEDYLSWVGRWIGHLLGGAWTVAVYFVAPVLAVEGIGPFAAMKRSTELVRKQWGDAVGAEMAMTWRLWPLHLFGLSMFAVLYFFPANVSMLGRAWFTGVFVAAIGFLGYIVVSHALHNLMRGIARSHLYLFTAFDEVPAGGNGALYRSAFRKK